MTALELLVGVAGGVFIIWELWYFLGPRTAPVAGEGEDRGVQDIRIVVRGGYDPDMVVVGTGKPVRIQFYRDEVAECSERVVFESLGIDRALPAFETTIIEFTPDKTGDYPFHCGRYVLNGRIVAQPENEINKDRAARGHVQHG